MAFVNKQGGDEARDERAASGQPIDFDPGDDSIVKVHYDLSSWRIDDRAELSEALAEAELPHHWDGDELVVPEAVEAEADAMFDHLEAELGPFPVVLDIDAASVEYGLDEWSAGDRRVLDAAMVESEIPHRWEQTTLLVATDAEEAVDGLLDAIESGELSGPTDEAHEPPDGALSDIFLAADRLAKDPFDARSRTTLIDLHEVIDPRHPPYALSPAVWTRTVAGVAAIVDRIHADADGERADAAAAAITPPADADERREESSDVIGLAQGLRATVRDSV
ncbi:hypothetical protein [Ilumatobacter sp.]|uniref:hypothetical protein n=1 Tax=Ilumatobacter sp. TaxID=1967498 RepID=UPI003B5223A3